MKRELLFTGNFVRSQNTEEHLVKGFLSMNAMDNEYDILPPEAFDLKSFMQKRTLLYNHKLWKDEQGNTIPIGEVTEARRVKLVDIHDQSFNADSQKEWGIKDVATGEVFDTFPKDRVPRLVAGDRGIFAVARVDIDNVWDRVKRGTLNGFSWKGLSKTVKAKIGKVVRDIVAVVDMFETSLVFTPAQTSALFVIKSKALEAESVDISTDESPRILHFLAFSPTVFTQEQAIAWLEKNGFDSMALHISDDKEIIALQTGEQFIKPNTLLSLQLERGVQAFVGVLDEQKTKKDEVDSILQLTEKAIGSKLDKNLLNVEKSMKQIKVKSADEKPLESVATPPIETLIAQEVVKIPEVKVEPVKVETTVIGVKAVEPVKAEAAVPVAVIPAKVDAIKTELVKVEPVKVDNTEPTKVVAKVSEADLVTKRNVENAIISDDVVAKLSSLVGQQVATLVSEKLGSMVGNLQSAMNMMSNVVQKLNMLSEASAKAVAAVAIKYDKSTKTQPAMAMAKSAIEEKETLQKQVVEMQDQVKQLVGAMRSMQKSPVCDSSHDEGTAKTNEKPTNPNDVFGRIWPFVGDRK